MRRRGKVPKGFRADDEKVLQMELNREHEEYVQRMRKERLENKERAKRQAAMQRRRSVVVVVVVMVVVGVAVAAVMNGQR
jgi:CHASE3 domain sensor protein